MLSNVNNFYFINNKKKGGNKLLIKEKINDDFSLNLIQIPEYVQKYIIDDNKYTLSFKIRSLFLIYSLLEILQKLLPLF